jgi:hypothetical protein
MSIDGTSRPRDKREYPPALNGLSIAAAARYLANGRPGFQKADATDKQNQPLV